MAAHWLLKTEPDVYSFMDLERDKKTRWDGIRNFEARNNLRAMKEGDLCLIYHTGDEKAVTGVASVVRGGYPDPTAKEGEWTAVDVVPLAPLEERVPLSALRAGEKTGTMVMVRKPRISVTPVTATEFRAVLLAGKTKLD